MEQTVLDNHFEPEEVSRSGIIASKCAWFNRNVARDGLFASEVCGVSCVILLEGVRITEEDSKKAERFGFHLPVNGGRRHGMVILEWLSDWRPRWLKL